MPYRATPAEWLALSAIAQQPSDTIRVYSLRVYLREYVGVVRPMPFIHELIKGGLIERCDDTLLVTLTTWGSSALRRQGKADLPYYLPVPEMVLTAKAGTHR